MDATLPYQRVILDIEGTICPISFVKDELFPYFLDNIPSYISRFEFPLNDVQNNTKASNENMKALEILRQFPDEYQTSEESLLEHIKDLVRRDSKDSILKSLQGFVWQDGYNSGQIMAPLYEDAIEAMKFWSAILPSGLFIYSSGSVKAQKLLFGNVKLVSSQGMITRADLNGLISDYFDTVNIGNKRVPESYAKILEKIGAAERVLFLSDNPHEVEAAIGAGMTSYIVVRPGNQPLSEDDKRRFKVITHFQQLF
ncbi:DEKNAAC105628 [Brettanomyces naardenensis]|uniref:Enolase-phosphatase E1 n=1 Tax=Brettanomyces naardenensis TaxID=13370 RepID=A0A448YU17_BRENA|nr:DEKNAAC105628 [Brettanomyces naardenensis]